MRVVSEVLTVWQAVDPLRLAALDWSSPILAALGRLRSESRDLATTYYQTLRRAEAPTGPRLPREAFADEDDRWRERALTSLRVTGTRAIARLVGAGLDPARALDQTGPGVAAASVRHTLAAGRSRVERATAADPAARGWLRVTDGDPCWWCAMLASRGAVYLSRESASTRGGTEAEYHDGCGCQPEPFFHAPVLPDTTREFGALWADSTQGLSGKDARLAFRRAYEARRANAS